MRIRTLAALLLLVATPAAAQWDPSKPVTNEKPLVSANLRNNWAALQQSLGGVNLLADPTFLIWQAGDSAAPAHWALSGAGAAVARAGTGLGDTSRKHGKYTAKVTAGGGAFGYLTQQLLTSTSYDDGFDGLKISAGAWVRATAASSCRLQFEDGFTTTESSNHTGGGAYEWLTLTHTINAAASRFEFELEVVTSQTCYMSAPTVVLGGVPPSYPQPARTAIGTYEFERIPTAGGNLTTGADKERWLPTRPGLILDVQLWVKTAPTTQAIIVDLNTWDGAAFTSMFSTRPQIAATATRGGAQPDTTYARRCFTAFFGNAATPAVGQVVNVDVDQIGSGTVGADLTVRVLYLYFERPLEGFLAYNEVN
jgi:hypothetical protein